MKLITLNTWGGRAGRKSLLEFFKKYRDVDIFCLQEMWRAPYQSYEGQEAGGLAISHENIMTEGVQEVSEILSGHASLFCPLVLNDYGLQMLIKKNLPVIQEGETYVYKHKGYVAEGDIGDHGRPLQHATFEYNGTPLTIVNFHGAWLKGLNKNKIDTEERIEQSKKIIEFTKSLPNGFIIVGDFNILPDTKSMAILEQGGLRNLIREYGVTSTRTHFYEFPEKYADYIFVSPGINIKEFKVLPEVVSDHSALYLEI